MFNKEDLQKLPCLETYVEQLEKLKNIDLSNHSKTDIIKCYLDHACILPSMFGTTKQENFNQVPLYRVRKNINKTDEDLNLIRTYSYPSVNFCNANGRANLKGRTVFYCSNNPLAAIFECKPIEGDILYLTTWTPFVNRSLKVGICLPSKLGSGNEWQTMAYESNNVAQKDIKNNTNDKFEHIITLNNFLSDLYVNEKTPYSITSWLSDTKLYGDLNNDYLIYPSVATKTFSCNLAIHPNIVDQYLTFEKTIIYKVIKVHSGLNLTLGTRQVGQLEGARIRWRNPNIEELQATNFMTQNSYVEVNN